MGKQISIIILSFLVLAAASLSYCKYRLTQAVDDILENSYATQVRGAANSGAQYTLKLLLDDMGDEINQTITKNGAQITLTSQKRSLDTDELTDSSDYIAPTTINNEYEIRSTAVITDPEGIVYEATTVVVYDLPCNQAGLGEIEDQLKNVYLADGDDVLDAEEFLGHAMTRVGVIKLWQEIPVKATKSLKEL